MVIKNILATDLVVSSSGKAIRERLTKNTVVAYATTLYVRRLRVSSDTTMPFKLSGQSLLAID
jgi:hypothetical protein